MVSITRFSEEANKFDPMNICTNEVPRYNLIPNLTQTKNLIC